MNKAQAVNDYTECLYARIQSTQYSTEDDMDFHATSLDINSLRAITKIQEKSHFPNLDLSISPEYLPTGLIHLTINYIQSKSTTPENQVLGHFTRRNLKILSTWYE